MERQKMWRPLLLISVIVGTSIDAFSTNSNFLTKARGGLISTQKCLINKKRFLSSEDNRNVMDTSESGPTNSDESPLSRRRLLGATVSSMLLLTQKSSAANAFDKTFPVELTDTDGAEVRGDITLQTKRYYDGSRSNSQQRAAAAVATMETRKGNMVNFNVQDDLLPSIVWGGALWLLSGSRSNPLATPVANIVYNDEEEQWLKDRNAGLFAPLPFPMLMLLGVIFISFGVVTQYLLLQLAEGDSKVTLQLAVVSLIGGGALELGRIASGEKKSTREDFDRDTQLREEFETFASKRLQPGGSCHRNDVVASFRRFYAKYRQVDSEEYPLTDLEIERLLRAWNKGYNQGRAEMTSAGFYYGIQINKDADVFV